MATTNTKKCCVIECKNKDLGADSGVVFYKFPTNKKLKKKWIDACILHEAGKDNEWEPDVNEVICNVHFVNGTRNPDDNHPCAVPQVFRSLRKGPKKKENFTITPKPAVKRLQSGVNRRASMATPSRTSPKIKAATPHSLKSKRPPNTKGGLKKPLRLTMGRGRPPKVKPPLPPPPPPPEEKPEESTEESSEEDETTKTIEEPVQLSEAGRPMRNKRKKLDEDYEDTTNLKSLSVLIERSGDKKVKLSSAEILVKEEPIDDEEEEGTTASEVMDDEEEEDTPQKATPTKVTKISTSAKLIKSSTPSSSPKPKAVASTSKASKNKEAIASISKNFKDFASKDHKESLKAFREKETSSPKTLVKVQPKLLTSKSPVKIPKTMAPVRCKKCSILEQKVFKMEAMELSRNMIVKCQRCPVIEQELKKVEEELEDIIESKLSKCQRCALIEQKCRRVENNLRKTQIELTKAQNRLAAIDINEETLFKYKNRVKSYTGFPSYEYLIMVFEHVKPQLKELSNRGITCFQMFILTIMKLKMNLPFWDLSYRFGAPTTYVQNTFTQYMNVLDKMLSHVVLWPKANMEFRLQVLAGNLKQSFHTPVDKIDISILTETDHEKLTDKDKWVRVCAAFYHISQLVSSNHSQQLVRILKTMEDSTKKKDSTKKAVEGEDKKSKKVEVEKPKEDEDAVALMNGGEAVDDSDIFLEDFARDSGLNSNDSLELELKHLRKELENTKHRLDVQFKFYTGLRNYQVFNNLLAYLEQHVAQIPVDKLSHFQQLHMVLIRFKLNLEVEDIGYLFNVDVDYIVDMTRLWLEAMVRKLSAYIDWPSGVQDYESERKLMGTVKLKYQILWGPNLAQRNKDSGRDKEAIELSKLLKACAAIYNIDDIEVFKNGKKGDKEEEDEEVADVKKTNEELEEECRSLREEIYELRKNVMSSIASCVTEEKLQKNDVMVKYLTGFPSFEVLKHVFNHIIPSTKTDNKKAVSPFQQFIMILLRLKLNTNIQDLSLRVGMGHSNTFKLINDWIGILHTHLSYYITWPDDDDDVEDFTDTITKTYAYVRNNGYAKSADNSRTDFESLDLTTLVCAGLYNIGTTLKSSLKENSDFESFDEEW